MSRARIITLLSEALTLCSELGVQVPVESATESKWWTQKKFQEATGYKTWKLREFKKRDDLIRGVHYRDDPAGNTLWNHGEMQVWQEKTPETNIPELTRQDVSRVSVSDTSTGAGGTRRANMKQRLAGLKQQRSSASASTHSREPVQ